MEGRFSSETWERAIEIVASDGWEDVIWVSSMEGDTPVEDGFSGHWEYPHLQYLEKVFFDDFEDCQLGVLSNGVKILVQVVQFLVPFLVVFTLEGRPPALEKPGLVLCG